MEMNWQDQEQQRRNRLIDAVTEARKYVFTARPNAHVMYTVNRQGERTHFGVYDCPLEVNEKGNLCKEQPAPQLLGDLIPYQKSMEYDVATIWHVNAWASASMDVRKLLLNLSKRPDASAQN
jgi:hypothetical protein